LPLISVQRSDGVERSPCIGIQRPLPWLRCGRVWTLHDICVINIGQQHLAAGPSPAHNHLPDNGWGYAGAPPHEFSKLYEFNRKLQTYRLKEENNKGQIVQADSKKRSRLG